MIKKIDKSKEIFPLEKRHIASLWLTLGKNALVASENELAKLRAEVIKLREQLKQSDKIALKLSEELSSVTELYNLSQELLETKSERIQQLEHTEKLRILNDELAN